MTKSVIYSNPTKFLHWLVAGLIVSQYVLAKLAEQAKESGALVDQLALLANHKSIGITILCLAIIRLVLRFTNKPPPLPQTMPRWQRSASHASHALLYGFLFLLPMTGWLMSSAKAYSVSWFNLLALPDFVSPNEELAEIFLSAHYYLSEALFIVALIHILAALKHHFIDKDDVLNRMANKQSWLVFGLSCLIAVAAFGRFFELNKPQSAQTTQTQSVTKLQTSDLKKWVIDYDNSYIKFTGDQAGAPFAGEWQKWQADIQFDPLQLEQARFDVKIQSESVFSNDGERDEHIRSPEFFNAAQFPQSRFQADKFERTDQGFVTIGQLTMKNFSSDATFNFNVSELAGKSVLNGTATLDRLVWNIGSGDWADTSWVGQNVEVSVRVTSK